MKSTRHAILSSQIAAFNLAQTGAKKSPRFFVAAVFAFFGLIFQSSAVLAVNPNKLLDETLQRYESTIRWDGLTRAAEFLDPEQKEKLLPQSIDLERYKQMRVSGYRASGPIIIEKKKRARQTAEIELINIHTQEVRSISEVQEWVFDKKAKRWWRVSALPVL